MGSDPWNFDSPLVKNFVKPLVMETQQLMGGIKRVMAVTCAIEPAIWVETLAEASLAAFWDVLEPDPKEVYHKVTGKSFVCDVTTTLEHGAKKLPTASKPATRFLFRGLAVYDLATWYFFLADVAFEGGIKWTSALYHQRQCPDPNNPNHGSGVIWGGGLHPNGVWGQMDFSFNPGSRFAPVSPSGITLAPHAAYTCAFTGEFTIGDHVIVPTPCRMLWAQRDRNLDYSEQKSKDGVAEGQTHVWAKSRNPDDEIMDIFVEWNWSDSKSPPEQQCFPTESCYGYVSGVGPFYRPSSRFSGSLRVAPLNLV